MNFTNFVNESRNVVWLSGYVRGGDENVILLYQSSNEDRAIPIHIASGIRRPRPNTPCEVKCHAFGYRDADGKNWVRLEALQVKRASVTATPRRLVALNALRPRSALAAADFTPFASLERIKEEVKESLKLDAAMVDSLLADASKRTSMRDGFQNKVILSGFIGHKAFIPPSDNGTGDLGYILFHLLQAADPERALSIRVTGADARFSKELKTLHPLSVIAEVRTHAEKDADGNITSRKVYLSTDRNNVGFATVNEFARRTWPEWWLRAVQAHYEQRRAQQAAAGQPPRAAAPIAPAMTPESASSLPPGVKVSEDVF